MRNECIVIASAIGAQFYEHVEFVGAFNTAFAERLEARVPLGDVSARAMLRAVATLRSNAAHAATLQRALQLLIEHCTALTAADVVERELTVVATFPLRT